MIGKKLKWFVVFDSIETLENALELEGVFVHRSLFGEILFVRDGNEIHAFQNKCPHQNKPLNHCKVVDSHVVCPFHQYAFSCENGRGQGLVLEKYAFKIEEGKVLVGKEVWTLFP